MKKYISIVFIVIVIGLLIVLVVNLSKKDQNIIPLDTYATLETEPIDINLDEQSQTNTTEPITNLNNNKKIMNATLNTNMGDIKIEFFSNDAPKTVENFVKLTESKFYDGVKFHRVINGFMIQGGDPLTKDDSQMSVWGTGGPGYKFNDEINTQSDLYTKVGYKKGIVAMANSGPNTNGSQFFIMNADYPLPPLYTIFGKVVAGQDVVDKIALVKTAPGDRPIDAVIIKSISLK